MSDDLLRDILNTTPAPLRIEVELVAPVTVPIVELVKDEDGHPVTDDDGNTVTRPALDEDGNPRFEVVTPGRSVWVEGYQSADAVLALSGGADQDNSKGQAMELYLKTKLGRPVELSEQLVNQIILVHQCLRDPQGKAYDLMEIATMAVTRGMMFMRLVAASAQVAGYSTTNEDGDVEPADPIKVHAKNSLSEPGPEGSASTYGSPKRRTARP